MVRDGNPVELREFCTASRLGGKHVDDVVDARKVIDQVRRGSTLVLQSLHRTTPSVALFVTELQGEVGHPVQANAYLTPADASGLAEHADGHDVIVLQLHGSKRWWVGEPDSGGLGDVEIGPGDSMYIPAGTRHHASTTGEVSLHLTLGIVRVTYRDVLDRMLARGPAALDRPLPIGFQEAGGPASRRVEDETAAVLDEVGRHLATIDVQQFVDDERQRRRRLPAVPGHLSSLLSRDELTPDTWVRWSAPAPLARSGGADPWRPLDAFDASALAPLRIHLGDRVLTVPPVALDAVRLLSGGDPVRVSDLPGLDPASRVVLARRLIEETACVIEACGPASTGSPGRRHR